jgi:6-phosphogluconolactonase (cycloisomerase 2 family)
MLRTLVIFILATLYSLGCIAQQCYVFVGSYNKDKTKDGIYVFEMDTVTGALTKVSAVDSVLNPAYLTLSPDGNNLYACTEAKTPGAGSISSYAFNPQTKALTFINSQKSAGENPVYVATDKSGKWLANGCYTEGSASIYPLSANGTIGPAAQVFTYTDSSINKERQERSHIHSAVFSPDNRYVYFQDLGADKIRCYEFNGSKKKPLQPAKTPFIRTYSGGGPRHFTFHPNGKFAYCIEELAGTITTFKLTKDSLRSVQRLYAHPDSITDGFSSADIHISPDGKFLYASNRGVENNIAIFSIMGDIGILRPVGYHTSGGNHPRIFALTPTGKFVVVANQVTGNVVVFKRNATTGLLEDTGIEVTVESASCVKIRQY